MNYKLGLLALVALPACISALPPCVCKRNFRPVCGTDGETYSNECRLNCEKYKGKEDLSVAREGPCDAAAALPLCICTMDYRPVCGNDGNTYPNRCAMTCTRSTNPSIDVAHEGECSDKIKIASIPPCTCPEVLNEVCGSDGNTYANDCLLNCATANDNKLSIAHSGKCKSHIQVVNNSPKTPPCTCTREAKPVCGSDGKTYANDCLLNCATANDNTLSISHPGQCGQVSVVGNSPVPPPCTCTREAKPVCGSDGKTYDNDCLLNCATANDNTLSISHPGQCGQVNVVGKSPIPPPCTCTREAKPVCGSDGKTYANDCLLNCATANDNTLSISHPGQCGQVNVVGNSPVPPPCTCTRESKV